MKQTEAPSEVVVGQRYRNPDDNNPNTTIRIVYIDEGLAVCYYRYADDPRFAPMAFVKSCKSILRDWTLVSPRPAEDVA
jgi:hypothetical protein